MNYNYTYFLHSLPSKNDFYICRWFLKNNKKNNICSKDPYVSKILEYLLCGHLWKVCPHYIIQNRLLLVFLVFFFFFFAVFLFCPPPPLTILWERQKMEQMHFHFWTEVLIFHFQLDAANLTHSDIHEAPTVYSTLQRLKGKLTSKA